MIVDISFAAAELRGLDLRLDKCKRTGATHERRSTGTNTRAYRTDKVPAEEALKVLGVRVRTPHADMRQQVRHIVVAGTRQRTVEDPHLRVVRVSCNGMKKRDETVDSDRVAPDRGHADDEEDCALWRPSVAEDIGPHSPTDARLVRNIFGPRQDPPSWDSAIAASMLGSEPERWVCRAIRWKTCLVAARREAVERAARGRHCAWIEYTALRGKRRRDDTLQANVSAHRDRLWQKYEQDREAWKHQEQAFIARVLRKRTARAGMVPPGRHTMMATPES